MLARFLHDLRTCPYDLICQIAYGDQHKYDLTVCPYLLQYLQLYFDRSDNSHILQAGDLFMKLDLAQIVQIACLCSLDLSTLLEGQTISRINNQISNVIRMLSKHTDQKLVIFKCKLSGHVDISFCICISDYKYYITFMFRFLLSSIKPDGMNHHTGQRYPAELKKNQKTFSTKGNK